MGRAGALGRKRRAWANQRAPRRRACSLRGNTRAADPSLGPGRPSSSIRFCDGSRRMSTAEDTRAAEFVAALVRLGEQEDRASLAALRRSLGRELADPAEAAAVFYRILPPVPEWAEADYWLAAGLFALHPAHRAGPDHGRPLAAELRDLVAREPTTAAALERRFVALLDAEREELQVMLRS